MKLFNFTKKYKINFLSFSDEITTLKTPPVPASSQMPDWYRKLPKYVNGGDKPIKALGHKDLKLCVPFRDAMISGYTILLPAEIEITESADGELDIFNNQELPMVVAHKRGSIDNPMAQGHGMPAPIGTDKTMFAWMPIYGFQTPKGTSVLVTHPFNRYDLPFVTTSGIIDSDNFSIAGNIPFFVKKGFTGIIPKGTPIAQIIPFVRTDWTSSLIEADKIAYGKQTLLRDSIFEGFYSRFQRQPKSFK